MPLLRTSKQRSTESALLVNIFGILKYIDVFDSSNNYIRTIEGIGEVSRMLNIRRGSVEKVLYGQRKTTKGFIFKYASL